MKVLRNFSFSHSLISYPFSLVLFLSFILYPPARVSAALPAGDASLPAELDEKIMRGIEGIYSLHFEISDREFDEIVLKYPGHPYGYFGKAITAWARLEYEHEESNPELDRLFQKLTEESLLKGKQWLKTHPGDSHAHMCVGGMYGLRSRLSLMQHRWIRAYFDGRNAISHTRKAVALNPGLYDAYLGLGMYEYYAGTLSGVVRVLAKFFMRGDPEKGIGYLKIAKEKGHFNATAAKLLLIEFFTQTGSRYSNPELALEWSQELRAKYPYHPMIHFVEIVSLYENKKWEKVREESLEYIKRIENEDPFYKKIYLPRALLALGTSYLAEHQWDRAEEIFYKSGQTLQDSPAANRWAVWAVVRLAQIYDLKGKRDLAVETYKKALAFRDEWGFKDYITAFLSRPYRLSEVPGQLPPP